MKNIVKSILMVLFTATMAFAWNDEVTHPTLSEFSAEQYFGATFMDEFINGIEVRKLIRQGATLEDAGNPFQFAVGSARSLNHFHNPTKSTLADAGLTDLPFSYLYGMSALLWAQSGDYQKTKVGGDWSWQAVRDYQYAYLTSPDNAVRNDNNASYLKGLGYQMHLVQDMGQPNHVRNDTHVADGAGWKMGLETWAKANDKNIKEMLQSATIPTVTVDLKTPFIADTTKVPVAKLFDTRGYPAGTTADDLCGWNNLQ